jgi:hypothetical protein
MKTIPRPTRTSRMSHDAYAGFLKLWLTPANRVPRQSPEVDAYLRHANEREPLQSTLLLPGRRPKSRAA